jgi:hypothetical protein
LTYTGSLIAAETTAPEALPTVAAVVVAETEVKTAVDAPPTDTVPPVTRVVVEVPAGEVVMEATTVRSTLERETLETYVMVCVPPAVSVHESWLSVNVVGKLALEVVIVMSLSVDRTLDVEVPMLPMAEFGIDTGVVVGWKLPVCAEVTLVVLAEIETPVRTCV